jgi:hypothetical protein
MNLRRLKNKILHPLTGESLEVKTPSLVREGRGHKAETNPLNRAMIDRITQWAMTPQIYRFPATQRELAIELNITQSWISKLCHRLPKDTTEFMNLADDCALARHHDVVERITSQAIAGDTKAQSVYMKHIAQPRRDATARGSFHFKSQIVNFGLNLIMGNKEQQPASASTLDASEIKMLGADNEETEILNGDSSPRETVNGDPSPND